MADNDRIIALFEKVIAGLYEDVNNVTDIMKDKNKKRVLDMIVSRLDELGATAEQLLPEEIMEEYAQGSDQAVDQLATVGMAVSSLNAQYSNRIHIEAVQELLTDTGEDLKASVRTAQMMGISAVDKITNNVTDQMAEGLTKGTARKVATNELKQYLADSGFTGFITSDNRRLPLDFYAKTVMRTKRKEANVKGMINRYTENGVEFVRINTHAPTCEHCAKYHRVIVQIQGDPVQGVTQLKDTQLPPYHPNCRCAITPISTLEGEEIINPREDDPRTEAQKRAYDSEQKIRRKANEEKKLYAKMKASGVDVPKTLGAFRRKKRQNDQSWQAMQANYRDSINTAVNQTATSNNRNPARVTANKEVLEQYQRNRDEATMSGAVSASDLKDNSKMTRVAPFDVSQNELYLDMKEKLREGDPFTKETDREFFGDITPSGILNAFNPDSSQYDVEGKIRVRRKRGEHYAEIKGELLDKDGNEIGDFHRDIYNEDGKYRVVNQFLELDESVQGSGIASNMYFKTEEFYKELSKGAPIDVELLANIDVGVYAWTRHGFDFKDSGESDHLRSRLKDFMKEDLKRRVQSGEFEGMAKSEIKNLQPQLEQDFINRLGYNSLDEIKYPWQFGALDDGQNYTMPTNNKEGRLGKYLMLSHNAWKGVKRLNQDHDGELIGNMYYQEKKVIK